MYTLSLQSSRFSVFYLHPKATQFIRYAVYAGGISFLLLASLPKAQAETLPPVSITAEPCVLPAPNGVCKVNVTLTNNENKPLSAAVWGTGLLSGKIYGKPRFYTRPKYTYLSGIGATKKVCLEFKVPDVEKIFFGMRINVGEIGRDMFYNIKGDAYVSNYPLE